MLFGQWCGEKGDRKRGCEALQNVPLPCRIPDPCPRRYIGAQISLKLAYFFILAATTSNFLSYSKTYMGIYGQCVMLEAHIVDCSSFQRATIMRAFMAIYGSPQSLAALHCTRQKTKGEGITPGWNLEVRVSVMPSQNGTLCR